MQKTETPKKFRGLTEDELRAKYPHMQIVKGSLHQDPSGKRTVKAKLSCGHFDTVFTSDLFQVKTCKVCKAKPKVKAKAAPAKPAAKSPAAKAPSKAVAPAKPTAKPTAPAKANKSGW